MEIDDGKMVDMTLPSGGTLLIDVDSGILMDAVH